MGNSDTDSQPLPPMTAATSDGGTGPSLRAKIRSGAIFWGAGNLTARLIRIAVHVVLAWLLDPTDYGLVAMSLAFTMLLQMFSEFGIVPAIIQKKDMPASYPSTAFWVSSGMSVLMIGAAWLLAPWLADFYQDPRVALLVRVSSLGFLVVALRTIPMALLRKRLQFGRYAALDTSWQVATSLMALVFAWAGARYWSLVIPQMVTGLLIVPAWLMCSQWHPSLVFDRGLFREIFKFSKNVIFVSLATFVLSNAGFVFAGHFLGTEKAGIYKFAMQYAMFVLFNFAWLVSSVTVSGFALAQGDNERLRNAFGRVYDTLLATTLPLHALLFVQADLVFQVVFPDKWLPAIPIFRILLVCAALRAVTSILPQFYYAINRPYINSRFTGLYLLWSVPAMYIGCKYFGLHGLTWATTITFSTAAIAFLFITPWLNRWASLQFIRRSVPCVLSSALLALVTHSCAALLYMAEAPLLLNFFVSSTAGSLVYPVCLRLVAPSQVRALIENTLPRSVSGKVLRLFNLTGSERGP